MKRIDFEKLTDKEQEEFAKGFNDADDIGVKDWDSSSPWGAPWFWSSPEILKGKNAYEWGRSWFLKNRKEIAKLNAEEDSESSSFSNIQLYDKNHWEYFQAYKTPQSVKNKCNKIDRFIKLIAQMMKRDEQLKSLVTTQNLKYMTTIIFDGDKKKKFFGMNDNFILTNGLRNSIQSYAEIGYARINRLQSEKFLPYIRLNVEWFPETDEFKLDVEVRKLFVQENPKNDQILEVIYNIIESTAKTAGIRLKKVRVTPNAHEIGKGGKMEWCKGMWKSKL